MAQPTRSYPCKGTTVAGHPCQNRTTTPGSWCGQCAGVARSTALDGTARDVRHAAVAQETTDASGREFTEGADPADVGQGRNVDYSGSTMRDARFKDDFPFYRASFDGCDLRGATAGAFFQHCSLRGTQASGAYIGEAWGCDFTEADLERTKLAGGDQSTYADTNLRRSSAYRVSFMDCDFPGADLDGCDWTNCDLSGADLSRARNLDRARLSGCVFDDRTRFPEGYDPGANRWKRRTGPIDEGRRAAMRAAAAAGAFSPYATYSAGA